jgi:predicted nucleic acid-binding Zn ribbon protein
MSEPVKLATVLSQLIAQRGLARRQANQDLEAIWRETVGNEWSALAQPRTLQRGVLTVDVTSAALLGELTAFHAPILTRQLQQRAPHWKLKSLKFRLATARTGTAPH